MLALFTDTYTRHPASMCEHDKGLNTYHCNLVMHFTSSRKFLLDPSR